MQLYNRLSRKVEKFEPLDPKQVTIYTCGPTVYDHAHIGNLSAYIFADLLRRTLSASGYKVHHAMNYTDVDDKTIRRSREELADMPPGDALRKLTDKYITIFQNDMQQVGNDTQAITYLRATDPEVIKGMQELITQLHAKGFAYTADDGVYFSIENYRKSGKTYGQLLEITATNTSEARIQNDEYDKDSVHDFALWKTQKEGEPAWEFTLDSQDLTGRPGWHIECSVMSRQALGQPFDIHTGGIDLIFPHHENEIAQSTALEENPVMAKVFAHNEHILVEGKKMSKSLRNFYTLKDITQKGHDPLAFRLVVLQGHYRNQVNFTWESLEAARNRRQSLQALADLRFQAVAEKLPAFDFAQAFQTVLIPMQADLNTPLALAALSDVEGELNERLISQDDLPAFTELLALLDKLFGLQLLASTDITPEQREMIADRQTAREAKEFAKADELRDQLSQQGLAVRDTQYGPIWSREN